MFSKFRPFFGPSRYVWKDPDTGREFQEASKKELIERITAYRDQNNLEKIENISFVLENFWCSQIENRGKCVPTETPGRTFMGYFKGGVALLKNMAYQSYVHQSVADRRADICVKCPHNKFHDHGPFVAWSNQMAVASVGSRRSSRHDELAECAICQCPLRSKVWYSGSIELEPEWIEPMEKAGCWQLEVRK